MRVYQHICLRTVKKLLAFKEALKERIPKALKENNYVQSNFIIEEQINKAIDEFFANEEE